MSDAAAPAAEVIPLKRRGAPAGRPKPENSGRKKGTKNRRTAEITDLLAEHGCEPLVGMMRIAMNPKNPPELRGKMFAELAQYKWPKKRAIEVTGDGGEVFTFVFQNAVTVNAGGHAENV